MTSCLVTGATGLIGSHLVRALASTHEVVAATRGGSGGVAGVRTIPLDLSSDAASKPGVLPPKMDAIVHLAQGDGYRDFPARARETFRVNTASTVDLLDYASRAGVRTFVLASTGGLYATGDSPCDEDAPLSLDGPLGYYLRTRRAAEILAQGYGGLLHVVVLRFFFVYGPGQRESMLIPRLIASVRDGRAMTLQGPDGMRLNPVHVDDAVRAVVRALALEESTVVNVAGPETLTMRAIGDAIGHAAGKAPIFESRSGTPGHLVADISRMHALGCAPVIRFADAIPSLV